MTDKADKDAPRKGRRREARFYEASILTIIGGFIMFVVVVVIAFVWGGSIELYRWWHKDTSCERTPPYLRFQIGETVLRVPSHYRLGWDWIEELGGYGEGNIVGEYTKRRYKKVCQAKDAPPFKVRKLSIYGKFRETPDDDPILKLGSTDMHVYRWSPAGPRSVRYCAGGEVVASQACKWKYGLMLYWSGSVWNAPGVRATPEEQDKLIKEFLELYVVHSPVTSNSRMQGVQK